MEKARLTILGAVVLSTLLGSVFTVSLLESSSATPAPAASFEYRAKWVCNTPPAPSPSIPTLNTTAAEGIGLVAGEYETDINVHNPSHSANITLFKKFVISAPELTGGPPVTTPFITKTLLPEGAFFIDCSEILLLFPSIWPMTVQDFSCAAKGFVILTGISSSNTPIVFSSDRLDVVAEYSSESFIPFGTFSTSSVACTFPPSGPTPVPCVSSGNSLDVERIPASPFVP